MSTLLKLQQTHAFSDDLSVHRIWHYKNVLQVYQTRRHYVSCFKNVLAWWT